MSLTTKWSALDDKTKQRLMIGGGLALVFLVSWVSVELTKKDKTEVPKSKTNIETTVMLPPKKNLTLENLQGQLLAINKQLSTMGADNERTQAVVRDEVVKIMREREGQKSITDPVAAEKIAELESKLKQMEIRPAPGAFAGAAAGLPGTSSSESIQSGPQSMPLAGEAGAAAEVPEGDGFRRITEASRQNAAAAAQGGAGAPAASASPAGTVGGTQPMSGKGGDKGKAGSGRGMYLPAGAMIQGVLLNGMDAPSSAAAVKQPMPALIRIKHEAILPNYFRADVRECFVLMGGYAVLSSERVMGRTEKMSCVRKDGGVIETPMEGYIVGEDGAVGLRGKLVSKMGGAIARAMAAGLFGGLAGALKPESIPTLDLNPSTGKSQITQPSVGDVFKGGAYDGTSSALGMIAKFYLDMAKEQFPVVEISAGRSVEIVLISGTKLQY